jgi:protein gp37
MAETAISWTDATWNPTTGCDKVSPGCAGCYALKLAKRLKAMGNPRYQVDGDPRTSGPGFGLTVHHDKMDEPYSWVKPRMVFVNSMSDLFHEAIDHQDIARVFETMAANPQHTFQVLTKRPQRMKELLADRDWVESEVWDALGIFTAPVWPLPNVWLGVSVENQYWVEARVPLLQDTPAAVRFLSCEPLLAPLALVEYFADEEAPIHWCIVGGESGRTNERRREMDLSWARSIRDQCKAAGVAFWGKQASGPTNEIPLPPDLQIREWPKAA